MNIQTYINQPSLIQTLTPQQKLDLFQQLQHYSDRLRQDQIKAQTQLDLLQKQQQDLFTELQQLTNLTTLPEIKDYIDSLQSQFDQQLTQIIQEFNNL